MPDWLDPTVTQLPRLFQEAGYKTGHFGKWHLTNTHCDGAPLPTAYGYDESGVFNGPGPQVSPADSGTYDRTIAFIEKHKGSPFFINVWMHESHTPHFPKEQFLREFESLDEQHRVYAAILAEADHGVGRILKTLDELNLTENTLVVFSSDNGPEDTGSEKKRNYRRKMQAPEGVPRLGSYYSMGSTGGLKGRKRSLFEGGVRVPFLVRWPGKAPAGKKDATTVISAVDLFPTFCAAAGIPIPETHNVDGQNMLEAFMGGPVTRSKPLFWRWTGGSGGDNWPRLSVRDGGWKLVMDAKRKALYHIPQDRAEKVDLAKEHPDIVKRLEEMAVKWEKTLPKHPPRHCISPARK